MYILCNHYFYLCNYEINVKGDKFVIRNIFVPFKMTYIGSVPNFTYFKTTLSILKGQIFKLMQLFSKCKIFRNDFKGVVVEPLGQLIFWGDNLVSFVVSCQHRYKRVPLLVYTDYLCVNMINERENSLVFCENEWLPKIIIQNV